MIPPVSFTHLELLPSLRSEPPLVVHRGQQLEPVPQPDLVVLLAVARGGVHQPCTAVRSDVVPADHHGRLAVVQRMPVLAALQLGTLDLGLHLKRAAKLGSEGLDQVLGHDQKRPGAGAARAKRVGDVPVHLPGGDSTGQMQKRPGATRRADSRTATARLAGMVQGVVVQMPRAASATRPPSASGTLGPTAAIGIAT